jgi:hypothetical protein
MIIISAACRNHYLSLRQFQNHIQYFINDRDVVYLCNLGLTNQQWNFIKSRPLKKKDNFKYIDIDFNKYPPHVRNLQSYAFKSACFKEIIDDKNINENMIWLDSATIVYENVNTLDKIIELNEIYSPYSAETIERYCHPSTISKMLYDKGLHKTMRSGGCIGIKLSSSVGKNFLDDFINYCLDKDVIIPAGSTKGNHRQDQSVLSILYWEYQSCYNFNIIDSWNGCSFHNNIHCIESRF